MKSSEKNGTETGQMGRNEQHIREAREIQPARTGGLVIELPRWWALSPCLGSVAVSLTTALIGLSSPTVALQAAVFGGAFGTAVIWLGIKLGRFRPNDAGHGTWMARLSDGSTLRSARLHNETPTEAIERLQLVGSTRE